MRKNQRHANYAPIFAMQASPLWVNAERVQVRLPFAIGEGAAGTFCLAGSRPCVLASPRFLAALILLFPEFAVTEHSNAPDSANVIGLRLRGGADRHEEVIGERVRRD
jgi:hypothetical protein